MARRWFKAGAKVFTYAWGHSPSYASWMLNYPKPNEKLSPEIEAQNRARPPGSPTFLGCHDLACDSVEIPFLFSSFTEASSGETPAVQFPPQDESQLFFWWQTAIGTFVKTIGQAESLTQSLEGQYQWKAMTADNAGVFIEKPSGRGELAWHLYQCNAFDKEGYNI